MPILRRPTQGVGRSPPFVEGCQRSKGAERANRSKRREISEATQYNERSSVKEEFFIEGGLTSITIGISRFVRNDICKRTALIRVIARSPSGQRGNLPELNEEITSPSASYDNFWGKDCIKGVGDEGLRLQAVAVTSDGKQPCRILRVWLDLPAQEPDIASQRAAALNPDLPPNIRDQIILRYSFSGTASERGEQTKFCWREIEHTVLDARLAF